MKGEDFYEDLDIRICFSVGRDVVDLELSVKCWRSFRRWCVK